MTHKIELIGIESITWPPPDAPGEPSASGSRLHWKVTFGIRHLHGDFLLQTSFLFDKNEWKDDSILPVAKHWFHNLATSLADETKGWTLSEEALQAYLEPQSRLLSPGAV